MDTQSPTADQLAEAERAAAITSGHDEQDLIEMTRCLTDTYTARGRLRLKQGEVELAVADLNEALRLAPDHHEARRLLDLARAEQPLDVPGSGTEGQGVGPGDTGGNDPRARFRAGYLVSARYRAEDNGTDTPLEDFPLTPEGLQAAIDYARHMCSDESSRERGLLYDAYLTGGEAFDAVVTEVRSISRQVHLVKALDDEGQPVID